MGREIRRVPPHWEHPEDDEGNYIPQFDHVYEKQALDFLEQAKQWERGEHPDKERGSEYTYVEWHGPAPDAPGERGGCMYLTEPAERSWWQMYENVTEGTPISPPFATAAELIDWIVTNLGRSREAAEKFVEVGSIPTMAIDPSGTGIKSNLEQFEP